MRNVMPITGTLALAILATAPEAFAQDTTYSPWRPRTTVSSPDSNRTTTSTAIPSSDTAFIRQAMNGNYTEIRLSRIADDEAENDAVEEFAQRMVTDHGAMNEKWAELAKSKGMRFELSAVSGDADAVDRLEDASDSEFDQLFMTEMIRRHELDLAAFGRMRSSAGSEDVRRLAGESESSVRQHLTLARQVGSQVGVASTAGRVGGLPGPDTSFTDRRRRTSDNPVARNDRDDEMDREVGRTLRREDRAFVENVLSDHLMHERLAQRAKRESKSGDIRQLADRTNRALGYWANRWENFADRNNANVKSRLEKHNREKVQRLDKAAERKDFDRAYADIVSEHLEMMIQDFRDEAREKHPSAVRRVIEEELPVLRQLQLQARKIASRTADRRDDSNKK